MTCREDKRYTEQYRQAYRDGLVEIMKGRLKDAKTERMAYFKDVFSNQESVTLY